MRTLSIVAVLLLLVTAGCAGVGGKYVVNETGMITVQLPPELYRLAIEKGMDPELLLARAGAGSAPASERGPGGQTGNVETTGRGESNQGSRNPFAALITYNFEMNGDNSDMAAALEASAQAAWGGSQADMQKRTETQKKENTEEKPPVSAIPYADLLRREHAFYLADGE